MIFVGDAVFPGGNDYPAKEAGAVSIRVRDPEETKRVCGGRHRLFDMNIAARIILRSVNARISIDGLGLVMEPEPGNPHEVEGVLNPAATRAADGQLYSVPATGRERELLAHRHRAGEV